VSDHSPDVDPAASSFPPSSRPEPLRDTALLAAIVRLLSELQAASNATVDVEEVWTLLGMIGATCAVAAHDLAGGHGPERIHQLTDQLTEDVARLAAGEPPPS
jgi:hypothetical protein